MILAGDIGGTNTRLALSDKKGRLSELREFRSKDHKDLASIVSQYLEDARPKKKIRRACFGVAGPVKGKPGKTF